MPETVISSFLVRIVQEKNAGISPQPYHGIIRHIQANQEIRFTNIQEALIFMNNYFDFGSQISDFRQETTVESSQSEMQS